MKEHLSEVVRVRVTKPTKRRVKRLASELKKNPSDVLREAIVEYVEKAEAAAA